jgi:arylsulfatase A-like enzyme
VQRRNPDATENGGLRDGKNSLYEGGLRVPAVAVWPGMIDPAVTTEVVSSIDLFATMVNIAGVSQVPTSNGVDVSELLFSQSPVDRSEHYILYDSEMTAAVDIPEASAAVIQYPYKLVRPTAGADFELYNLEMDRVESKNLMSTNSAKAAELEELLNNWLVTQ